MEMVGQLAGEHAFSQLFLERAGQAGFAEDGLGILVLDLGQKLVDQFIGEEFGGFRFLGLGCCAHWCGHGVAAYQERVRKAPKIAPFASYLHERVTAASPDGIPATVLWREIQAINESSSP